MKARPEDHQVEVSVFGPGYGECIVVHLGGQRWIVVDSCTSVASNSPVALRYFELMDVDAEKQVDLIVITHWHDDHIRGMSELIDVCKSAHICISDAFTKDEFLKFFSAYSLNRKIKMSSGVDEIMKVLKQKCGRIMRRGSQDKRILNIPAENMAHGHTCEVWTLSPSDFQITESQARLASLIPQENVTMRRAVPSKPNNHSVAMWVVIGGTHIILGSDLEQTTDNRAGWESVVTSPNRPSGEVSFFKVPHHGSRNAHHDDLWTKVLRKDVNAVVTPWDRNKGIPTKADMDRLNSATKNLFLTSQPLSLVPVKHSHGVEQIMREVQINTKRRPHRVGVGVGAVTARFSFEETEDWKVYKWEMK